MGTHPFDCFCPVCRGDYDDPNIVKSYRMSDGQAETDTKAAIEMDRIGQARRLSQLRVLDSYYDNHPPPWDNGQKGTSMNLGQYANNQGGDFPPLLDAKSFNKERKGKAFVTGKVLAVREIKSPGGKKRKDGTKSKPFAGIALDIKVNGTKYGFLTSYERFDVSAIIGQMGSAETDDWIGENLKFVAKKGSRGGVFINVASK